MKRLLIVLVLAVLALAVIQCGSDDDDDSAPGFDCATFCEYMNVCIYGETTQDEINSCVEYCEPMGSKVTSNEYYICYEKEGFYDDCEGFLECEKEY